MEKYRVTFLGNDGKLHRITVKAVGMIPAINKAILKSIPKKWSLGSWLEKCEVVHG